MASLSIGMLNVRSLLHKIEEIRLSLLVAQFDVLCISETWLDESVLSSELEVIGYSALSKHINRHGGGILIYVNDKLDFIRRCDLEIIDLVCVWIEIRTETGKMLISSIYRPPSTKEKYLDTILDSIERAHDENCIILVVGDLNIDCDKPNTQLSLIENLFGLTQLVTEHTRVTNNSSSLIYLILTTNPEYHLKTNVFILTLSDHYLVYTVLLNRAVKSDTQAHRQIRFRNYNKFVLSDFIYDVRYELLSFDVNNFTHIDEACMSWKNCFDVISNRHTPIKKSRFKKRSSRWVNGKILKLIYKRDYLHKQAILLKSNRLMNEYRQLRNDIHKKIGKLKKITINLEMQGNPNALWKELAELTACKHKSQACNKLSADDFNDLFSNIGREKTKTSHSIIVFCGREVIAYIISNLQKLKSHLFYSHLTF